MYSLAILLLAGTMSAAPAIPTTTLILRNGTRYEVDGPIREEQGRIIFRNSGSLYSIPLGDVDLDATRASVTKTIVVSNDPDRKFKVSAAERERLLRALEQNHSGEPAPDLNLAKVPEPRESAEKGDEWSWRAAARSHEEEIRRAKEDVELLHARVEALKHQIEQFFSLGFHPNQFSYQSSELEITLAELPAAELAVTRAQRANDQFREDARKLGITPGWLR
jgi:hypothetical protein